MKEIEEAFRDYFDTLYTTTSPSMEDIQHSTRAIQQRVTAEMTMQLNKDYTRKEIEMTLNQMAPLKSPVQMVLGHFLLEILAHNGDAVCKAVFNVLQGESMVSSINYTCIALFPKVKNPENVIDFRPISLYNVIYKLLYKVIANRLKCFMHCIISSTQSVFIPDRLITDNISIAYEILHTMKINTRDKEEPWT